MSPLPSIFDAISSDNMERSKHHLCVGELIDALTAIDGAMVVEPDVGGGLGRPHSYRGYYEDIALERRASLTDASSLLSEMQSAVGRIFVGYKGGNYLCTRKSPLWISGYGSASGIAIVGAHRSAEKLILNTRLVE